MVSLVWVELGRVLVLLGRAIEVSWASRLDDERRTLRARDSRWEQQRLKTRTRDWRRDEGGQDL